VEPQGGPSPDSGWARPDSPSDPDGAAPARGLFVAAPEAAAGPGRTPPILPVPLRPMTLSDLLDGAFRVIKSRPRTVFGIAATILVPVYLVGAFFQRNVLRNSPFGLPTINGGGVVSFTGGDLVATLGAGLLVAAALFPLGGALARLVTAWYAGGDLSAGEALAASFRRLPAMVAAFVVLLPLKVVGYAFEEVGALVPVTLFMLTAPAITVEGLGPIAAARRSWRLVSRRFWPCLLVVFVCYLGSSVLSFALGIIPEALASLLPSPLDWLAAGVARAAVAMVVATAVVSVAVLLYLDLRIRTEGLDLELEAADVFPRRA